MEKIIFQPNVPVRIALKYADGKTVEGRFGDQEYYALTDGRCMYVNPDVASKINQLELKPSEPFEICKYWSGKKGESPQWDVRRVDGVILRDQISAAAPTTGIDESDLERDLRRSLKQRTTNGKPGAGVAAPAPEATAVSQVPSPGHFHQNGSKPIGYTNGNGKGYTNPVAQMPEASAGQTPALTPVPVKIPLNVAFREILHFCTEELQAAHEQWSDAARQDLVSTLLIQASKEGWCTIWERTAKS